MINDELIKSIDVSDLLGFEEHPVWQIVQGTIDERLDALRGVLERGYEVRKMGEHRQRDYYGIEELKFIQGECKGLRFLSTLIQTLKEGKEEEEVKNEAS